jgi:hypothetical protein
MGFHVGIVPFGDSKMEKKNSLGMAMEEKALQKEVWG